MKRRNREPRTKSKNQESTCTYLKRCIFPPNPSSLYLFSSFRSFSPDAVRCDINEGLHCFSATVTSWQDPPLLLSFFCEFLPTAMTQHYVGLLFPFCLLSILFPYETLLRIRWPLPHLIITKGANRGVDNRTARYVLDSGTAAFKSYLAWPRNRGH